MKKYMFLLLLFLQVKCIIAQTNSETIIGIWVSENADAKIQIYKNDQKYFGKLVWLKQLDLKDRKNPTQTLRDQPLLGKIILSNFVWDSDNVWDDGEIYDPESGKTYSCTMKLKETAKLSIRGYIGISLFGRSSVWTRE